MPQATESLFIDTIIDNALGLCRELPEAPDYLLMSRNIRDLRNRLAHGRLHIAVLGQFNRGKSTFINSLLGMEILPTSVLPITSVPTIISFGEKNECVISFSDKKEDATVIGEPEEIMNHLAMYVTEKSNPKNRLCVSEAVVTCKSSLLGHGTVLIDTPGFGSTFTHNTKTTLDLLASCDAALFLLSADLPITQVEVDFLESVIITVPRLFFIYNKTDLLNKKELESSEQFIKDTLIKTFCFSLGVKLFSVSAKIMEGKKRESEAYKKSGLAAVEKEIIEFLLREKYFTLSEALTGKFKDALTQIIGALEKSRDELLSPINEIKEKLDQISSLEKMVTDEMGKALSLSEAEETDLLEHGDKLLTMNKESLHAIANGRLKKLLDSSVGPKQHTLINSALIQLVEEIFSRMFVYFVNKQNKPLRKIAAAHIREIVKLSEKIEAKLTIPTGIKNKLTSNMEDVEIDVSDGWRPETPLELISPKASFRKRFYNIEKRNNLLFEHYSVQIRELIDPGLEELLKHVNKLISSSFALFVREFRNDYNRLMQTVKEKQREVEAVYKETMGNAEPEISKLEHLISGFSEVKDMVL